MQMTITNDGIAVTDALKQYIAEKFKRLERISTKTTAIHITLSLENLEQVAKVLVHTQGTEFYARAASEDLYTTIDHLVHKIDLQLTKHKQKEKEKRRDHSERYDENSEPF